VGWIALASALGGIAALSAAVVVMWFQQRDADTTEAREHRFVDTATQTVVNMFSYTQDTIDQNVGRFVDGTSGPLRGMLSSNNNVENIKALFRHTNASSEAVINGAALEGIDDVTDNASVGDRLRPEVSGRRQLMRWLITAVFSLLITAFVGLAAAGGWFYWDRVQTRGEQAARAALPALAKDEIPRVFAYDFQTVERSLSDAFPLLTPAYRREFEKSVNAQIIPEAKKREVVVQASVVGVGVMAAKRDSASVMVYMNRTVTDKSKEPVYDGSRLRVDYQRVGGKWLINYITPI
jgi:Mce-associated membrane protein